MPGLTAEQKREACLIASIGCSRGTAARYVGCGVEDISAAALQDAAFARELARAEAGIELSHMRCVQQAARDERHWRASVWWLERHAPDLYARRNADAVTPSELNAFLGKLTSAVSREVKSTSDQDRLLKQIMEIADGLELGEMDMPLKAGAGGEAAQ